MKTGIPMTAADEQACWAATARRDASEDGRFYFAVTTTGIFCKPSCPARRPKRENVRFFFAIEDAMRSGFRPCLRCRPATSGDVHGTAALLRACRHIEQNLDARLTLKELARLAGFSPWHFQRRFKEFAGVTPAEYTRACRMWAFKKIIREGRSITDAVYDAGYGSPSRLYERAGAELGMAPTGYRAGGKGEQIRYAIVATDLGPAVLAATDRGICAIQFADSEDELTGLLRREFPKAELSRDDDGLKSETAALVRFVSGRGTELKLPLDVRATAFQERVWRYLRTLDYGETRTYTEVAEAIGQPRAARAVARACATNPVALAIPCHRVLGAGSRLAGYRWGIERKQALLARESGNPGR